MTSPLSFGIKTTPAHNTYAEILRVWRETTDVISAGRLIVGIGVGGTRQPPEVHNPAVPEYAAYGLDLASPADGIGRLAEACVILRRMWTEPVFDFSGRYYRLAAVRCEPKPVQRPGPPTTRSSGSGSLRSC